jgi:glycosyltransferase involved in cell wall biosynthesis
VKILSLTKYGKLGASSRLRTLQYLALLEKKGIDVSSHALISDKALLLRYKLGCYSPVSLIFFYIKRIKTLIFKKSFDLVWIEKEAFPWFPVWIELLLLRGKPFILDYDDATFHNYDQNSNKILRYFFHDRLDRLMAKSSLVVCGNLYLQKRALTSGASNTVILPTVVNLDKYPVKEYIDFTLIDYVNYQCKIVWIGSPSTQHYLELIKGPLQVLSRKYNFILRVIGSDELKISSVNIEIIPWTEEAESKLIRDCDIGIMPLLNTSWEKGKCGYKLIQYMASGLPVVASPIGVNQDIICHGKNGFLANNENEWVASLDNLLGNSGLRSEMGLCGRQDVVEKYSLTIAAPNLINNFRKVYEESNEER